MSTATARTTEGKSAERDVRGVLNSWLQAVRASDADAIRKHYAEDIVAFDAVIQLQFKGRDAYMQHWSACLDMCPGPMLFEMDQTEVSANDGLGFSRSLLQCGYTDQDGTEKSSWMRVTTCYEKRDGRWLIVHEHFSAPFDCESGKAIFDAQP